MKFFAFRRGLGLTCAVMLLLILALTGCNRGNDNAPVAGGIIPPGGLEGLPSYLHPLPQRVTLRIGSSFGTPEGALVPPGTTPSTSTINQLLLEHLNIELYYMWEVPSAQAVERLQLALAAGDVPDIMRIGMVDFMELSRFGMLRDLSEAYENHIHPQIREMYEQFDNVPLQRSSYNGQLLGIPHISNTYQQISLLWYRHDWLEALGLGVPTTMDELHAAAVAFVENDMSGQGNTTGLGLFDTIISWAPDARGLFHGYGAYPTTWREINGELVFGTVLPETQQALNRLRRMYADGALNPEFATMNLDQLVADISADRVGFIFGEWWLPNWPFNHNMDYNPAADWRATIIVTPTGEPGTTIINRNNINLFHVVSANAPEGAEEALVKLLNQHWDISTNPQAPERYGELIMQENGWVANWVPGWVVNANEQFVNYILVNEALRTGDRSQFYLRQQFQLYELTRWFLEGVTFYDEDPEWETPTRAGAWGMYSSRVAPYGGWGTTMQVRERGLYIFNEFFGEPTPTQVSRGSILNDMWLEFYALYIMGDLPYEAWDTFVADWWRLGGEDWTREVNEQFRALQ